ncbi:MAG: dihydroneopterin aldolase [Chromatiales bacterium]|jgi:7,8-dihydroneopterin aldolase/epimerase/oxygenase|nr:dihydroneopterin aldolase [Chromatiales bacterium]
MQRTRPLASDIVFLRNLAIETVIGIYDWERRIHQTLLFDIEMAFDIGPAAESEDIEQALNYKAVAKRVAAFVGASECQLVETLAERTAQLIRDEFGVTWVRLTVNKKGAVSGATDVGVIIERGTRA